MYVTKRTYAMHVPAIQIREWQCIKNAWKKPKTWEVFYTSITRTLSRPQAVNIAEVSK